MLTDHALADCEVLDAIYLVLGGVSRVAVLSHQALSVGASVVGAAVRSGDDVSGHVAGASHW